jgi:hypothetical protein
VAYPDPKIVTVAAATNEVNTTRPAQSGVGTFNGGNPPLRRPPQWRPTTGRSNRYWLEAGWCQPGRQRRVVLTLSGMRETDDGLGHADRSDAALVGQARSEVHDGLQLRAVGLERASGVAQRNSESPALGCRTAWSRLASRGPRRRTRPAG